MEVASDGRGRIFFIHGGERTLALSYVPLEKIEGEENTHPILDNSTFFKRAALKEYKSLPVAKMDFLKLFPDGFKDDNYLNEERNYKVAAQEQLQELLNEEVFRRFPKANIPIRQAESECPIWAKAGCAPIWFRFPARLSWIEKRLSGRACGSILLSGGYLSRSCFSPIPAWLRYPPVWLHSNAVPKFPNTVRWDYTCCGMAGSTAAG